MRTRYLYNRTKNTGGSHEKENFINSFSTYFNFYNSFSGTLEEKKDFMFIVTDSDGLSYAFNFEEKPEGLDDLNVGDTVKVTYTGTVSEIDPFVGEIISIERVAE